MNGLKPYLRGLVLIATFVAAGFLIKYLGLAHLLDEAWIDREIRGQGLDGELLFVAVAGLATAAGVPRQGLSFLAGYAFGLGEGTVLGLAGTALGCVGAFYYARLLGRSVVLHRFPDRIARIDAFLHENPLTMSLMLRLSPVGSNLITNLAAGVSGVRALPFFAGSVIGYAPQTLIFALLGSGIHLDPALRIGSSIALFVATGALGVYLFRRYQAGRARASSDGGEAVSP